MQAQDRLPGPQVVPVAVVNARAWLGRGLYFDVLALAVNVFCGVAAAIDIYVAGYLRAATGVSEGASFSALARLGVELALFVASFAWISSRLLRAAYKELPRMG